jgi:hypothetical protein
MARDKTAERMRSWLELMTMDGGSLAEGCVRAAQAAGGFRAADVATAAAAFGLDDRDPVQRDVLLGIMADILFPGPASPFSPFRQPEFGWDRPLTIWTSGRYQRDWRT